MNDLVDKDGPFIKMELKINETLMGALRKDLLKERKKIDKYLLESPLSKSLQDSDPEVFSRTISLMQYSLESDNFTFDNQADAPACDTCGEIMVRSGSCYKCLNCGATSGCS